MAGMILKFHPISDSITFNKILGKFVSNLVIPMPKDVDSNFHVINHHLEFFHISFINSNQ
jgi:hypothetical protein